MNGELKRNARKKAQHFIPLGLCQKCGAQATDRHHPDHSKPLDVVLLCRQCHLDADAELLREKGVQGAAKRWAGHFMTANCTFCGEVFTKERARQTTCSRSCGNKQAWVERRGGIKNQESPE
jgi:uncharacterized Zn finger protein